MGRGAATSPSLHGSQLRGPTRSWAVGKGVLSRCHAAPSPLTPPHTLACQPPCSILLSSRQAHRHVLCLRLSPEPNF